MVRMLKKLQDGPGMAKECIDLARDVARENEYGKRKTVCLCMICPSNTQSINLTDTFIK